MENSHSFRGERELPWARDVRFPRAGELEGREAVMVRRTLVRFLIPWMVVMLACDFRGGPAPDDKRSAKPDKNAVEAGQPASRATPAAVLPGSSGVTHYVRPDGAGTEKCTGLADAPYPGSGTGRPCAWDHPFRALPPGGVPRIAGGDTLIVAPGAYKMGYGAPGTQACDEEGSYGATCRPSRAALTRIIRPASWDPAGIRDVPTRLNYGDQVARGSS